MNDDLGDRMKEYEAREECRLMPMLPTVARVDGRSFHTFTHDLERPFCARFHEIMQQTAMMVAEETQACIAYTQSDEITFVWHSDSYKRQIWFDGKHSKMVSNIAAQTTLHFYRTLQISNSSMLGRLPTFDARVWQVPNRAEAINVLLWREQDATKNSIQMAAQSVYNHAELQGKHGNELQDMLHDRGINWNDYPTAFKRGSYVRKHMFATKFTADELEALPPKHNARTNPDLEVERYKWEIADLPIFSRIANKEAVVFEGAEPLAEVAVA